MDEKFAGLGIYTTKGQVAVLLAIALRDMRHGPTRQECLEYIQFHRWLDIQPADLRPYPTAAEPRWKTVVSWAREALASHGYVDRAVLDSWQPTKGGLNAAHLVKQEFSEGLLDVRKCYMWSESFKSLLQPSYTPAKEDCPRPLHVYEDELTSNRRSVRGTRVDRLVESLSPEDLARILDGPG